MSNLPENVSDFKSFVGLYKDQVYNKICEYLPSGEPVEHCKAVRVYVDRKGKYGRPGYLMLWNALYGGNPEDAILPAAAQQCSEDWILMHDDWMDGNTLRRGGPSAHLMFGDRYAINAGDHLHMSNWKMAKEAADLLGKEKGNKYFNKFYDMMQFTARGQYKDISLVDSKDITKFTPEDYYDSIHGKTAYYTVYGPMQAGAIIAGQPDEVVEKIKEYGTPLGKAFQIKDDVLDCISTDEELGKSVGNDVREGVKTIILWHAVQNASSTDLKKLKDIYAKERPEKTETEVKWVLEKFKELGSTDYAAKEAEKFNADALKGFEKNAKNRPESQLKKIARDSIEFVTRRKH